MRPAARSLVTSLLLMLSPLLGSGWAAAGTSVSVFSDHAAGVRFPVPFAEARFKSAAQVRQLLLRRPGVRIPPAAQFTTGIYSNTADGLPYLLLWKLKLPTLSAADLAALIAASGLNGLYGAAEGKHSPVVQDWSFRQDLQRGTGRIDFAAGLHGQLLAQVVKGGVVYLGYFYREDADAAGFASVASGLVVLEGRSAPVAAAPRAVPVATVATILAFVIAVASIVYLRLRYRSTRSLTDAVGGRGGQASTVVAQDEVLK